MRTCNRSQRTIIHNLLNGSERCCRRIDFLPRHLIRYKSSASLHPLPLYHILVTSLYLYISLHFNASKVPSRVNKNRHTQFWRCGKQREEKKSGQFAEHNRRTSKKEATLPTRGIKETLFVR